ncbi:MAG: hypothetical protein DRP64_00050 [Verrucomicrobia bacterium]|nr:MAG: hypothetical protein DRP64_00050 [Verrucomicrobiota bacterium]
MAAQPEVYDQVKVNKDLVVTHVLYDDVWHPSAGAIPADISTDVEQPMMKSAMGKRKAKKARPPKTVVTSDAAPVDSLFDDLGSNDGNDS